MSDLITSFADDFANLVKVQPHNPALVINTEVDPQAVTYQNLDDLINRCLVLFQLKGLKAGDTILALMPNAAETMVVYFATIKGGYGFAPLPCNASKREIALWTGLVKPKLCITTDLVSEEIKADITHKEIDLLSIEANARFDWLPEDKCSLILGGSPRTYLATSGTTGDPKAMVLDSNRLWSSGRAFIGFHHLKDASSLRFWNYLPMSYLGGLYNLGLIPICMGASVVIDEAFSGKTFLQFWQTVERYDISALWLVPTIVRGLIKMSDHLRQDDIKKWAGKVQTAFLGTAPIDLATKQRFEEIFGFRILENFALSETTFFTSETAENIGNRLEYSVGEILPYAKVKFVPYQESNNNTFEIFVKSPFLFLGYLGPDGHLIRPFDDEGYFGTNDCGHLDNNDLLIIDGRKRDVIKKGGNFVSLREVEVLACQHEAVLEAAGVGVKHDFYGESFVLYVILKDNYDSSSEIDISTFIHKNLLQYKWPEKIIIKKEFLRTPGGKVIKHLLNSGENR